MGDVLSVAAAQCPAELDGPEARLEWLHERLVDLDGDAPDLIVLPELFQCGYDLGDQLASRAQTADGPFAASVADLAKAHGVAVLYGFAEREGGALFNAAQSIDRRGEIVGRHRKLALPPGRESGHFRPGTACGTFRLGGFRVAILICYDVEFPENARRAALAGADLVAVPTALGSRWDVVAERVVPARAFENGVFVCYANWCGEGDGVRYLGGSRIVGPDGRDLATAGAGPEVIGARLERLALDEARRRLPYLVDRAGLISSGSAGANSSRDDPET